MEARKKVVRLGDVTDHVLREQVLKVLARQCDRQIATKDFPLIEAALAADGIIISRDEEARFVFNKAAGRVKALREILWVNPVVDPKEVADWLEQGAPMDQATGRKLTLGH